GGQPPGQVQAPAAGQKTGTGTGLIQQIDREKAAVTIRLHGINVPGTTLSFMVKDKTLLANLRPSQKVDFEFTYDGKQYLITGIK
ncbi:MAG: copper-binding protein, partial [Sulfuricaulis sp.]|nr:copper-binding protein [Sulfuricaulis sp.]